MTGEPPRPTARDGDADARRVSGPPETEAAKPGAGKDDQELSSRLDALGARLKTHGRTDAAAEERQRRQTRDATGFGQALRLSSEFIAGVLVGAGLGWVLDWVLGTSPFGLIVLLLLGFAAGVLNVMRAAGVVAEPRTMDQVLADEEKDKAERPREHNGSSGVDERGANDGTRRG